MPYLNILYLPLRFLIELDWSEVDTCNRYLDRWMIQVPDQPKYNGYQSFIAANSNAIYDKFTVRGWACDRLAIYQW